MVVRALGNDTITLVKPTIIVDPVDNTEVISFDTTTEIVVRRCMIEPFLLSEKLQEEITGERDFVRSTWRVWAPATADVLALSHHDRIIHQGQEYEVFGHLGVWRDFAGRNHHVQFIIELREG